MNSSLDIKIRNTFAEESVLKIPERYSVFSGKNLPSFIKDWLIKRYTDEKGELNTSGLLSFLDKHIPEKGKNIKGRIINKREDVTLLARIMIEPDVKSGTLRFAIPDIEIKYNEGRIAQYIAKKYPELEGGEVWGVVTLSYIPPRGKEKGIIEIIDYKPFKPYQVDLEYYQSMRSEYTLEEWLDLIIRSMEYNPNGFDNLTQKLSFITRLAVFVEPRLNMIELAPKGTGKSYVYGNLSKFGWPISGGTVSRAKLFYDVARGTMGIITIYDFVVMDEIETIKFTDENELRGALKNYLELGFFTVANIRKESGAGLMLLGNIKLTKDLKPKNINYFKELPTFFHDSALLDRFHGFIEGWRLPRINEDLKVKGYVLNVEYFSEILHSLRYASEYSALVDDLLKIPNKADTRDITAIKRLTTAYLKILFPNAKSGIDKSDIRYFCLEPALERRGIVRKQLHLMDSEFKEEIPIVEIK